MLGGQPVSNLQPALGSSGGHRFCSRSRLDDRSRR